MNVVTIALALSVAMGCADERTGSERARPPRYDYRSVITWSSGCSSYQPRILPPRLTSREEAALGLFAIRMHGLVCFTDQPAFAAWLQLLEDDILTDEDLFDVHIKAFLAAWERTARSQLWSRPPEEQPFPLRWTEMPPAQK